MITSLRANSVSEAIQNLKSGLPRRPIFQIGLLAMTIISASACTSENRASANIVQKTGYLMQCAARSSCPPMHNQTPEGQARNDQLRARKASEPPPSPPDYQARH
jgi:hypothetical protein